MALTEYRPGDARSFGRGPRHGGRRPRRPSGAQQDEEAYYAYLDSLQGQHSDAVLERLAALDFGAIDHDLVVATIRYIALREAQGAILCFLPGWDDISQVYDRCVFLSFFFLCVLRNELTF